LTVQQKNGKPCILKIINKYDKKVRIDGFYIKEATHEDSNNAKLSSATKLQKEFGQKSLNKTCIF